MGKVAYGFQAYDEDGRLRENSHLTAIRDTGEELGIGSVIEASFGGFEVWEIVEIRTAPPRSLRTVTDADGTPIPIAGTIVCRGIVRDNPDS